MINDNIIGIKFTEESRELYVKNILDYLHFTDPLYYYLFFGYSDGNVDMDQYYKRYPELLDDKGFIKIKNEDINDYKLIYDLLFNYQLGSLYINTYNDLDKKYSYMDIRDNNFSSLFNGYVVLEMRDYFTAVQKDFRLPDWDLEKMGISEDMIIEDDESTEKNSLSDSILSSVKRLFTRFKK